jgi:pSer/pThr/pTyr-binding forkhead associated (FHA) protein
VIQSGKVSREHAVIVREGDDYYIEDLESSNGTWFNKQRLKQRRRIDDGDEYYICSERVRISFQ